MKTPLVIFGAGGFAREILQLVNDLNADHERWEPLAFFVDPEVDAPASIHGIPVVRDPDWLESQSAAHIVIAVGSSSARYQIAKRLPLVRECVFASLVHPKAWVGRNVEIGPGSVICAGALITTDITIGSHVHVNIGCTVGHDALLRDFCTLNPSVNVSGNATVGFGVEIGTGSVLIPKVRIGDWSIVGAGSLVIKSVESNSTAVGAPARVIKTRPEGWHFGGGGDE